MRHSTACVPPCKRFIYAQRVSGTPSLLGWGAERIAILPRRHKFHNAPALKFAVPVLLSNALSSNLRVLLEHLSLLAPLALSRLLCTAVCLVHAGQSD